jgi:iron complex outermembrane receptor protein
LTRLGAIFLLTLSSAGAWAQEAAKLPEVVVVGASPLLGTGLDRTKVPAATNVLTGADVIQTGIPSALGALDKAVPGVSLGDAQGNRFQPNLLYRGFSASPLDGNAQGLAVYVNGVRFNQPFSDSVNWDLLPDIAIDKMNLQGSNPVFGLNALGGSLSIQLKNGFTWKGGSAEAYGGSFGTIGGNFEYGLKSGNTAAYAAINLIHSDGWRQFNSSDLRQFYGDVGWRGDAVEVHLNVLAVDNILNGPGTVPVELLGAQRNAAFTSPNLTANKYGLVSLSGTWDATDNTSLQGLLYYSNLSQRIANGNTTNAQPCGGFLCDERGNVLHGRDGAPIQDFLHGGPYTQINTEAVDTNGFGAALQGAHEGTIFGLRYKLVAGVSFDGGISMFTASTAVGGLIGDRVFAGPGIVIDEPNDGIAPVRVRTSTAYYGAYIADVIDLTPMLSLSLSGRMNVAQIGLQDLNGTALNGSHNFVRFNPGIGLTYRVLPNVSVYASYSEANRAPTPSELSCASAQNPCTLTNFFVGDPSLKQVVSHTFEIGVRGQWHLGEQRVLDWNAGAFRTDNNDEILFVASPTPGLDFFQNVSHTRRQGIEAGVTYRTAKLKAWLNYAFTDATFQTALTLNSPLNPAADANGQIHVVPGNRLPGIPRHRLKAGLSYAATEAWTIGASALFSSGQTLFGDEANLTADTGAYVVLSADTSYQLTDNIQIFSKFQNLLNAKYATFGTFSPAAAITIAEAPGASNNRSLSPAAPIAAFAGVRVKF